MKISKMSDAQLNAIVCAANTGNRVEEAWKEIERRRFDTSMNESIYGASGREDESLNMYESEF